MRLRPRLREICVRSLLVISWSYARGGDSPWVHQGQRVILQRIFHLAIRVQIRLQPGCGRIFATCDGVLSVYDPLNGAGDKLLRIWEG